VLGALLGQFATPAFKDPMIQMKGEFARIVEGTSYRPSMDSEEVDFLK
jgi:hypothetical protein